jgi:hypothetical protein
MRKRVVESEPHDVSLEDQQWLNLEALAEVEVTSEDPGHPIESGLIPGTGIGWRAEQHGPQTIRLLFHEPQRIERINLVFEEHERARTQEFVLRWSADGGRSYADIVRQQFNFSPPDTTMECEDYRIELAGLTALEIRIIPDMSGGTVRASLAQLRLA